VVVERTRHSGHLPVNRPLFSDWYARVNLILADHALLERFRTRANVIYTNLVSDPCELRCCATLISRRLRQGRHVFDPKERCVSREIRSCRQANDEPSLGMSIGLLCVVLFALFAIVSTLSVPDIQFVQTDFSGW
jgi:hypothetical protein